MHSPRAQSPARSSITCVLVCWLATYVAGFPLVAQEAADFFRQNCTSCHTIGGGRLTGPDLKGVLTRKDREWLARFVQNPQAMMDQGDPYALQLRQEARDVVMHTISGVDRARAESLLTLIEAESKLEKSQFAACKSATGRSRRGTSIRGVGSFWGLQRLTNAGLRAFLPYGAGSGRPERRAPGARPDACI